MRIQVSCRGSGEATPAICYASSFAPDGTVLEGPYGPVSHLICGGMYDWSTGLLYRGGRYFDPALGIWLALVPLMVVQGGRKRKSRRQGALLLCVALLAVGTLVGCEPPHGTGTATPTICATATAWPTPTSVEPYSIAYPPGPGCPDCTAEPIPTEPVPPTETPMPFPTPSESGLSYLFLTLVTIMDMVPTRGDSTMAMTLRLYQIIGLSIRWVLEKYMKLNPQLGFTLGLQWMLDTISTMYI